MNSNKKEAAIVTVTLQKCAMSLFSLTCTGAEGEKTLRNTKVLTRALPEERQDKDPCDLFRNAADKLETVYTSRLAANYFQISSLLT